MPVLAMRGKLEMTVGEFTSDYFDHLNSCVSRLQSLRSHHIYDLFTIAMQRQPALMVRQALLAQ